MRVAQVALDAKEGTVIHMLAEREANRVEHYGPLPRAVIDELTRY
ncbi:MAG: hypothetical protein ACXVIS_10440 [Halobacteriota archaeon]